MYRAVMFMLGVLSRVQQENNQVLTLLEKIMAQLDDLNTALDAASAQIDVIKSDVDTVLTELQNANANPTQPTDLTATIAKVQAISAKLSSVTDEFPAAPANTPVAS